MIITPFETSFYITWPILLSEEIIIKKNQESWASYCLANNDLQNKSLGTVLVEKLKVSTRSLFNNVTTPLIVACQSMRLFEQSFCR